jgi:hypothetical protein
MTIAILHASEPQAVADGKGGHRLLRHRSGARHGIQGASVAPGESTT